MYVAGVRHDRGKGAQVAQRQRDQENQEGAEADALQVGEGRQGEASLRNAGVDEEAPDAALRQGQQVSRRHGHRRDPGDHGGIRNPGARKGRSCDSAEDGERGDHARRLHVDDDPQRDTHFETPRPPAHRQQSHA